jgi:hypothetical protein
MRRQSLYSRTSKVYISSAGKEFKIHSMFCHHAIAGHGRSHSGSPITTPLLLPCKSQTALQSLVVASTPQDLSVRTALSILFVVDPATILSEHSVYAAIHAERHAAWRALNTPSQPKHPLRNPSSAPVSSMRRTRSPPPRHRSHRHTDNKAPG